MNEPCSITVLIPTTGRSELLSRTLDSLRAVDKPESYCQTLVIENGDACGAKEVVAKYRDEEVSYIHVARANKSYALNVALEQIDDSHVIVFFDDDVRLHPKVLEAYAAAFASTETSSFWGGPMGVDYETEPPEWLKAYLPGSAVGWSGSTNSDRFLGCNWAARVADLRAIGGFNPDFGPGVTRATGQECEAQSRLQQHGVRASYVPDAMVWHYVPRERCSTEWAIQRASKNGFANGVTLKTTPQTIVMIRVKRMVWGFLRRFAWVLGVKAGFIASFSHENWSGILDGIRASRARTSAEIPPDENLEERFSNR